MLKIPEMINLKEILNGHPDAIVLDYNGVIFDPQGKGEYPQARLIIEEAKEKGIRVYISSNSTAAAKGFTGNMEKMGYKLGEDYSGVMTAGETFRVALTEEPQILNKEGISFENKKIYTIGHVFPAVLESTGFETTNNPNEADFAYIGIPQLTTIEYEKLTPKQKEGFAPSGIVSGNYDVLASSNEAAELFYNKKMTNLQGLKVVNANQDITAGEVRPDSGETVLLYRQGCFAKLHEENGNNVVKMGKPHPDMMKIVINRVRKDTSKLNPSIVFLGDNLETDIKGVEKIKEDSNFKDAKLFCVLCINNYWKENSKEVAMIMKTMKRGALSQKAGNNLIKKYIATEGQKNQSVPDKLVLWTTKNERS